MERETSSPSWTRLVVPRLLVFCDVCPPPNPVTFDYRQWKLYKAKLEPYLKEITQSSCSGGTHKLSFQSYAAHPFIDVYVSKCNKGIAFDYVSSKLSTIQGKDKLPQKIMYLGDLDNDNPAFEKADFPIGIKSDDTLNPNLSCTKIVEFHELTKFLGKLMDNDFVNLYSILKSIIRNPCATQYFRIDNSTGFRFS